MFRPKPEQTTRSTRQKLASIDRAPCGDDLRLMYGEADRLRGILIEIAIMKAPVFILTCQWDTTASEPLWSLYEGEDGSKVVWTHPTGNLEMIEEVLLMSLPGSIPSSSIPAHLAPPSATAVPPEAYSGAVAQQQIQGYPYNSSPTSVPGAPGYSAPSFQPGYAQPSATGYPQQMPDQTQYPQTQLNYPQVQTQFQRQPNYPEHIQPPQATPQQYQPQQAYQQQQQQQQPPQAQSAAARHDVAAEQLTHAQPQDTTAALRPMDLPGFKDMLSKGQSNILLGYLMVEAGIIPEPVLDAALKVQELVRKSELSDHAAIQALRKAVERSGNLDAETIAQCRAQFPLTKEATPRAANHGQAVDSREAARQAIDLVRSAGIVGENDVATAENVRRKHGGDVGAILVAAGKIERAALDAALTSQQLLRDTRLNYEEALRIIRHCQNTKESFDCACRDLEIRVL